MSQETSRKARGLATDVSQGQTRVSQGQMSCNRRLARTGVSTPACLPTSVPCLFVFPAFCALIVPSLVLAFSFLQATCRRLSQACVSQGQRSRNGPLARTDAGLARADVLQQTSRKDWRIYSYLSSYFCSALFRLPSLLCADCPFSCAFSFLQAPEEESRKRTSRKVRGLASTRLARPEVSQTDVSQGQTRVSQGQMSCNKRLARTGVSTPTCLPTSVPCLFIFPALCALIVPSLVRKRASRRARGLATDVSQGQTRVSQGQMSCNRRLARTGVSTTCLPTSVPGLFVFPAFCALIVPSLVLSAVYELPEEDSRKHTSCKARGLATDVSQGQTRVSQGQMSCNRRLARTGVSTPTCLPTSVLCFFVFPAFCALIVPSFVLSAFYKLPEEESRKRASRKVRGLASVHLARPEVSQRTSRKDRRGSRKGRRLATNVSQGLAYLLLLVFLLLFRACSSSQPFVR